MSPSSDPRIQLCSIAMPAGDRPERSSPRSIGVDFQFFSRPRRHASSTFSGGAPSFSRTNPRIRQAAENDW
jgi:hypothetical protein